MVSVGQPDGPGPAEPSPMPVPGVPVTPQQWPTLPPVPGLGSLGPRPGATRPGQPSVLRRSAVHSVAWDAVSRDRVLGWESYRTDVAGRNILVTTDDSNFFIDRNGNINGNTGDTDASGLNVTDATNSVIRGTESADEAPYQTVAAGSSISLRTSPAAAWAPIPTTTLTTKTTGMRTRPTRSQRPAPVCRADACRGAPTASIRPAHPTATPSPDTGDVAVPVAYPGDTGNTATRSTSPNPTPVATAARRRRPRPRAILTVTTVATTAAVRGIRLPVHRMDAADQRRMPLPRCTPTRARRWRRAGSARHRRRRLRRRRQPCGRREHHLTRDDGERRDRRHRRRERPDRRQRAGRGHHGRDPYVHPRRRRVPDQRRAPARSGARIECSVGVRCQGSPRFRSCGRTATYVCSLTGIFS